MTGGTTAAPGGLSPPGWYGKVSMLGDFAQRRLPPAVVQRIDAWLSGWIVESRGRLGDRWLDAYLSAPLLRFAWAPGVIGPTGWFGVLMPSCDRTGRYFPLLVADAACPEAPGGRFGTPESAAWFDRIATAATRTLDDDASIEAFEDALAVARPAPDVAGPGGRRDAITGDPPDHGATCWWTRHPDGTEGRLTRWVGLPEAADLTRLWLFGMPPDTPRG